MENKAAILTAITDTAHAIVDARGAGRISEAASRLAHSALEVARNNAEAGRADQARFSIRIAAAALVVEP